MIPTPRLLAQIVDIDIINNLQMDDRDTKGDFYESKAYEWLPKSDLHNSDFNGVHS